MVGGICARRSDVNSVVASADAPLVARAGWTRTQCAPFAVGRWTSGEAVADRKVGLVATVSRSNITVHMHVCMCVCVAMCGKLPSTFAQSSTTRLRMRPALAVLIVFISAHAHGNTILLHILTRMLMVDLTTMTTTMTLAGCQDIAWCACWSVDNPLVSCASSSVFNATPVMRTPATKLQHPCLALPVLHPLSPQPISTSQPMFPSADHLLHIHTFRKRTCVYVLFAQVL